MRDTPREKAIRSAETGRNIAAALRDAIFTEQPSNSDELFIHAHRLQLCNQSGNIWLGTDLHNADGEAYDASGKFWNCGSKLCPSCVSRQSKRNRNRLRAAIAEQKLRLGERFGLMTLTMPVMGLGLLEARSIMHRAWTLFRKRKWFVDTMIGCAKSEEFTLTKNGFHYHTHLLTRTRYFSFYDMRSEWSHCLRKAFENTPHQLNFATVDRMAVCHYTKVSSIEGAIKEVAKYITKSDSWLKLRHEDLIAVASIPRFPRMFELLGTFKIPLLASVVDEGDLGQDEPYLDTKSVSDGESVSGWRGQLKSLGAFAYLHALRDEINEMSAFRILQLQYRFPIAKFTRLKAPPLPSPESVLGLIDRIAKPCERCHRPMSHHDPAQSFANSCTLLIG